MRVAALDLGSGTTKLSVFEKAEAGWTALALDEANTELRRGMGAERLLQAGPVTDTLAACANYLCQAKELGVERLPAYATSAVRKAANPEALLGPLKAMGIEVTVLGEEDEGRWNLLGALARLNLTPAPSGDDTVENPPSPLHGGEGRGVPGSGGHFSAPSSFPKGGAVRLLVIDPGGDSTECTADLDGKGWERANVASLPFGSVSLQERFGSAADNAPIGAEPLGKATQAARDAAQAHSSFKAFLDAGLLPAIRMNAPIQRALVEVNGHAPGEVDLFTRAELEQLLRRLAALDHAGRAKLLDGEPIGKVDRTCYGFASWLGVLDALGAKAFVVEPWGIKLGAVIALNGRVD